MVLFCEAFLGKRFVCCALTIVYSIYNTVGQSIASIYDLGYGPPYRTIYITYKIQWTSNQAHCIYIYMLAWLSKCCTWHSPYTKNCIYTWWMIHILLNFSGTVMTSHLHTQCITSSLITRGDFHHASCIRYSEPVTMTNRKCNSYFKYMNAHTRAHMHARM